VPQRVLEQVQEDLLETVVVGPDGGQVGLAVELDDGRL